MFYSCVECLFTFLVAHHRINSATIMCTSNAFSTGIRWAFNFREWKPTHEEWILAAQCIQKEEKYKINRFAYAQDAKASMIGRLLMRKAASESSGSSYDEIHFSRTESGKPYIDNFEDVFKRRNYNFNISHHGDFCCLAAEYGANVGVDIMKIEHKSARPVPDYFNLMKKQFSYSEWMFLTLPALESEQLARFFRLWCLKESYVKATGTGIAYSLKNLSFHCPTAKLKENDIITDTKLFIEGDYESTWKFEELHLDAVHCVAVAVKNDYETNNLIDEKCNKPLKFTVITFDKLMENSVPFESVDDNFWRTFSAKPEKPQ